MAFKYRPGYHEDIGRPLGLQPDLVDAWINTIGIPMRAQYSARAPDKDMRDPPAGWVELLRRLYLSRQQEAAIIADKQTNWARVEWPITQAGTVPRTIQIVLSEVLAHIRKRNVRARPSIAPASPNQQHGESSSTSILQDAPATAPELATPDQAVHDPTTLDPATVHPKTPDIARPDSAERDPAVPVIVSAVYNHGWSEIAASSEASPASRNKYVGYGARQRNLTLELLKTPETWPSGQKSPEELGIATIEVPIWVRGPDDVPSLGALRSYIHAKLAPSIKYKVAFLYRWVSHQGLDKETGKVVQKTLRVIVDSEVALASTWVAFSKLSSDQPAEMCYVLAEHHGARATTSLDTTPSSASAAKATRLDGAPNGDEHRHADRPSLKRRAPADDGDEPLRRSGRSSRLTARAADLAHAQL